MKKYKVGDTFLMMEFDIDTLNWHFSLNKDGRYSRDKFDIIKCQVVSVEVFSLDNKAYGDPRIVSKIKYTITQPNESYRLDIYTDDGKFNYFFEKDEKERRNYTVIVGKDIAEIKKNITKLSKAIIEQLSPQIKNDKN